MCLPLWTLSLQPPTPATLSLQYLGDLGCDYIVLPNDAVSVETLAAMQPLGVLVSPGPGAKVGVLTGWLMHKAILFNLPCS